MNSKVSSWGWIFILISLVLVRWSCLTVCNGSPPTLSEDFVVFYLSCSISMFTDGEADSCIQATYCREDEWFRWYFMSWQSLAPYSVNDKKQSWFLSQAECLLWLPHASIAITSISMNKSGVHVFSDSISLLICVPQEMFKYIFGWLVGSLTMNQWVSQHPDA